MVTSDRHLESLVAQLRSSQSSDRQQAAQALARLGPAAQAAIPALIQTFRHDDDKTVQGVTAFALRQMGSAVVQRETRGVDHWSPCTSCGFPSGRAVVLCVMVSALPRRHVRGAACRQRHCPASILIVPLRHGARLLHGPAACLFFMDSTNNHACSCGGKVSYAYNSTSLFVCV